MSVEERVIEIVSEQMGVAKDQVTRETSFVNDLGADSLDTVELVMEFEEEFDITIPDEEAEKIQTVGQAITVHRGTYEVTWQSDAASSSPAWGWSRPWARRWTRSGRASARARAASGR